MAQMSGPKTDRNSENPAIGRKQNGQKFGVWAGRPRTGCGQECQDARRPGLRNGQISQWKSVKKYNPTEAYVRGFDPCHACTFWILALRYHQFEIDFRVY